LPYRQFKAIKKNIILPSFAVTEILDKLQTKIFPNIAVSGMDYQG